MVAFRSLTEELDSESAQGRFFLQIHGAMAEYFLDLNRERTMEGLKAALARGRKGGRRKGLSRPTSRQGKRCCVGHDSGGGHRQAVGCQPFNLLHLLSAGAGKGAGRRPLIVSNIVGWCQPGCFRAGAL